MSSAKIKNNSTYRVLLTSILLAAWYACTLHCSLEMMTSDEPLACCDDAKVASHSNHTPVSPDHCVCDWVKSGGYALSKCVALAPAPDNVLLLFTLPSFREDSLTDQSLPKPIDSPPEPVASWQFSFRTASPPRAPSMVS
jgi:hypothetical protein